MSKTKPYPATPELDKMKAVREQSQAIGEFIDIFLSEKGVQLGKPHVHTSQCPGWEDDEGVIKRIRGVSNDCGFKTDEFEPFHYSLEKLLAEFFKIDLAKCETERRAILASIRKRDKP
jgi:hypothetical protein